MTKGAAFQDRRQFAACKSLEDDVSERRAISFPHKAEESVI